MMKTFALAGNPNSGKTTLFNALTGATAHVGNWPGVTVEQRKGVYRNKKAGIEANITDLPGIYSLSPYTPEEVISRNFILDEHPDAIINIVDVTNLERNLYLTTQLLEMDVPVIVALNMMDALEKQGSSVNAEELSKKLGVPVVEISALKNEHIEALMKEAAKLPEKRKGVTVLTDGWLGDLVKEATAIYSKEEGIVHPLFHAIKALENDEIEAKANKGVFEQVAKLIESKGKTVDDLEAASADGRYQVITEKYASSLNKKQEHASEKLTLSDKIDRVLTNRWAGIPIFVVLLYLLFRITFAENLFYADFGIGTFDEGGVFEGLFYADGQIMGLGTILANFVNSVTGWFTGVVGGWMENAGAWQSFVCDGILGGIFAVVGFLPQILLLFFFFSILEDSGYMARVAFILDRMFRRFGLSGRAIIPMIMGFGCSVPAMVNTRTLSSDKERIQTIRVVPFFVCSAKLPIVAAVGAAIGDAFGVDPAVTALIAYFGGILIGFISVIVMHLTTQREKVPPFIMELPAYHMPQAKALGIHVWDKAKHSFKKLFTIIFVSTVIIWAMLYFRFDWQILGEEETAEYSILGVLGSIVSPIFTPLGWGTQLVGTVNGQSMNMGWAFAVSALNGLVAKENAIATFATIANSIGAGIAEDAEGFESFSYLVQACGDSLSIGALYSFIFFNVLTVPCFAAVATAKAELPKGTLKWTVLFWLGVSYVVSCMVYTSVTFIWPIAIWAVLIIGGGVGIYFYNKHKVAIDGPLNA